MQVQINKYRCITKPVSFEIKPITFLFGDNSTGKSTILEAIWAVHDVMVNNVDNYETPLDIVVNDKHLVIDNNSLISTEYIPGLFKITFVPPTPLVCAQIPDRLDYLKTYIKTNTLYLCNHTDAYLHPKQQLKLASIWIEATKNNNKFLIETHSEYMLLRVLKLIRIGKYNKDDLNILYLQKDNTLTTIRVDEDGDFIDMWPEGFFNDRVAELYYDEE